MAIRVTTDDELVRVTWHGDPDEEALLGYFEGITAHARSVERYAILYDFRRAELPNASRRRLLASLTRDMPPDVRRNCVAVAFVIGSAAIRGALTVILWFQPMSVEHVVVESVDEAERWLAERLRSAASLPRDP